MKVYKKIDNVRRYIKKLKTNGKKIGFVPTMGALHKGHLSLVEEARKNCDIVTVSIFVNPLQFGPNEDLNKYPRQLEKDIELLENLDVDILFNPEYKDIYGKEVLTKIDMPELFNILCGKSRPGHFSGVCIIVSKLLNILLPDNMYMGEKDYQQLIILKRLVYDLSFETSVIGCPIIRDADGLALSSRNKYLSKSERTKALSINKSRKLVSELTTKTNNVKNIEDEIKNHLNNAGLKIDYVEIRRSEDLKKNKELADNSRVFIAAFSGNTRLIDNFSIQECKSFL